VIATPGRMAAHLSVPDEAIVKRFRNLQVFVADEADRLIEDSIAPDVHAILSKLPHKSKRQNLLFSATIGDSKKLFAAFDDDSMDVIDVNPDLSPVKDIHQSYIFIPSVVRLVYLVHVLRNAFAEMQGIIFTSRCEYCQLIGTTLELMGFSVTCLHSMQTQRTRRACLAKFRGEVSKILVATDVASRGLDIPKTGFVVNFQMPWSVDDYVHRIGRTGRAGRQGIALSFVSERKADIDTVVAVERQFGISLEKFPINEDDVLTGLNEVTKAQKEAALVLRDVGLNDKMEATRSLRKRKCLVASTCEVIGLP